MSELTGAEVDATVFATHPGATNKTGRGAHKPGIGVIVGRAGLATEVGIVVGVAHETTQTRGSATHATHQQLLNVEGALGREGLALFGIGFIDDVAVAILDTGYQYGVDGLTIIDGRTIGTYQFEQIDIAGTKRQRRSGVELGLDTHLVSRLDNAVDAYFLTQTNGHAVDTHGEGLLQGDVGT